MVGGASTCNKNFTCWESASGCIILYFCIANCCKTINVINWAESKQLFSLSEKAYFRIDLMAYLHKALVACERHDKYWELYNSRLFIFFKLSLHKVILFLSLFLFLYFVEHFFESVFLHLIFLYFLHYFIFFGGYLIQLLLQEFAQLFFTFEMLLCQLCLYVSKHSIKLGDSFTVTVKQLIFNEPKLLFYLS